jgi:flagellar hook-basal body complex protein FliE
VAADAVDTARTAEQAASAGLRGDLDTQSVVEATLELETTLRVAVSMRDKFVQAYQEILRMPL